MELPGEGAITSFRWGRYTRDGKAGSLCPSDRFGLLIRRPTGGKIADLSDENVDWQLYPGDFAQAAMEQV